MSDTATGSESKAAASDEAYDRRDSKADAHRVNKAWLALSVVGVLVGLTLVVGSIVLGITTKPDYFGGLIFSLPAFGIAAACYVEGYSNYLDSKRALAKAERAAQRALDEENADKLAEAQRIVREFRENAA